MTRKQHSVIYQLASTRTLALNLAGYVGMDEYMIYTDRYKEHLTRYETASSNPTRNMSQFGGPGSWIFVPYIFSRSSLPVKKPMLLTLSLESREIQLYPKHLSKEQRFRPKRVKTGTAVKSRHAARARDLPSASCRHQGSAPVRLQLMTLYGNTLAPNVRATDLTEAFSSSQSVCIQSLLLSITDSCRVPIHSVAYSDTSGNLRLYAWTLIQVNRLLVASTLRCDGYRTDRDGFSLLS